MGVIWGPVVLALTAVVLVIASRGSGAGMVLYAFGVGASLFALRSPAQGVVAILAVASVDGILKGVLPGWYTLLLKDVVMWLAVFRWLALRRYQAAANVGSLRVTVLAIVFILWVCAEAANVFAGSLLVSLAGIRSWVGWMPVFLLAYEGFRDRKEILSVAYSVVVLAGFVGAYGVVQQMIGMDHLLAVSHHFSYIEKFGLGVPGKYRVISTMPHPGMFGHYMATALPIALAFVLMPGLSMRHRLTAGLAAAAIAGGAIASGGRLAFGALLTSALLLLLLARNAKMIVFGGLVAAVIAVAVVRMVSPDALRRSSSVFDWATTIDRITYPLKKGWRAISEHPLGTGVATGVGVGRALALLGGKARIRGSRVGSGMVEGEFGRAFRELGVPGGLLFVWLVGTVMIGSLAVHRRMRDPAMRAFAAGLTAAIISVVLGLLVGPALYLMPMAAIFWIAYASVLRIGAEEQAQASEAQAAADQAQMQRGTAVGR